MGGAGYGAPPRRNETIMTDANHASRNYRGPVPTQGDMHGNRQTPARHSGGRPAGGGPGGTVWSLRPEKSPSNSYTFGNL
jgi:vesicle-fusing ATPase